MQLDYLVSVISQDTETISESIKGGNPIPGLGLRRSARLPVMAALSQQLRWPIVLVTDRANHALMLLEELKLWAAGESCMLFPEPTPLFYEDASWGEGTRRDRMLVLTTLAAYHIPGAVRPDLPPVIVAPARALMTRTIPRRDFLKSTHAIRAGQTLRLSETLKHWMLMGYERVNTVISPGEYARRGGILDLWPPAERLPVRIELFGDEIDTIRRFDPATQRSIKFRQSQNSEARSVERVLLTPAREFLFNPDVHDLDTFGLESGQDQDHISEFLIPVLHQPAACMLDYLPRESLVLFDNTLAVEGMVTEVEEQAVSMRDDFVREGTLAEDFPIPYLSWSEIQDSLTRRKYIELGPAGAFEESNTGLDYTPEQEDDESRDYLACAFTSGPRYGGRLKVLMEDMLKHHRNGERLILVSRQSSRLEELWGEQFHGTDSGSGIEKITPTFIEGSFAEGWIYRTKQGEHIHLLTDGEIFGWRRPQPRYRRSDRYQVVVEDPETAYSDLHAGDYVVHVDYGVARYSGLVTRTVDQVDREYIHLEYADKAELFVPVHQVDRLTRYVGPDNRSPTLSRLGGKDWRNTKQRVREAVKAVAEDLLELYANRSVIKGYAFNADTVWQQELEASFPYIETEDQQRVLEEVKTDMEAARPMDRLICGDVGYGKTEVALRAAFKAINSGKQVAVLVPTTVLAQQHYHTFTERLAAFPVEVEMLSRFRTPQQQQVIIDRLSNGQVDIVIGTHRLFSSDVEFKELGLLIIDEEQRFGVAHKEQLKKLRTEIDVLTLTATPIPRTLYMALSGVRDISTINTPPEERLPVVTHVGPYSKRIVRQAILRELERGGQVFFVHNRVQTIEAMSSHIRRLVPEARITIAHGQMSEKDLSQRMDQFTAGEIDVLLSTSIIESGLDIPSANTLIVDRADMFGLAQLYQLRGRVGRGALRAYAYFFKHRRMTPTPEGRQRLETIAENTQLGSGFSIAMRDLEIRGTGDILGTRQHGHIAAVGFHLYTRLLGAEARSLRSRGELPAGSISSLAFSEASAPISMVNIELPLAVSLPSDYIGDKSTRLGIYRRLADMRDSEEIEALAEELVDRFGPLPGLVENLLFQARIKILAERSGLASLTAENGQFVMRFSEIEMLEDLPELDPYGRIGKTAIWMPYMELLDWKVQLVYVLKKLVDVQKQR